MSFITAFPHCGDLCPLLTVEYIVGRRNGTMSLFEIVRLAVFFLVASATTIVSTMMAPTAAMRRIDVNPMKTAIQAQLTVNTRSPGKVIVEDAFL